MNDRLTACVHKNSKGAYIDFLWDGEPFLTNESGELDLWLENEERTIQKHIDGWVANNVRKSRDKIVLSGQVDLPEFTAKLRICVTYRRVNEACWEKSVCLLQTNIPMLFCSVKSSLRAAKPAKLWSFDNVPHAGGIVHGTYPAIGVTFENGVSAGLLSDAGHRNWWTRNIRRRPNPGGIGFDALVRLCDGKMLELRENEAVWTLGLLTDYAHGEQQALANPSPAEYIPLDGCTANERGFAGSEMCGGCLPYSLQDGFYTFSFDYCSAAPVSVRVLKNTPDSEVRAFHYQSLPAAEGWQHFEDSFFLSDTEGLPTLLKIFEEGPGNGNLEISNIRLTRSLGKDIPYHPLRIGEEQTKRLFIFGQEGADLRTLRLASQTFLADGLGFAGKEEEKVLFADLQMLTWITGETDFTPLNVPSINYAPDMYNRDSFWSCAGVDDKELSEGIFLRWGATQTEEGGIGTIVTPSMGSVEVKENEATCEWLWWAYWNKKHYGSRLPMQKIKKAWKFCNNHFDPQGTGVCEAHFVLGQNDVTTFPDKEKSKTICVNQGVWAVTLKVAAALGLPVKPGQIRAAEERYRSFYSTERGYMLNDTTHPNAIAVGDLMPEFASLWLFDEPILSDEMVCNTLDRLPRRGAFAFIIGDADCGYFTDATKPYDESFGWPDGVYYNGASWMREEVMGYAVGARHGWKGAKKRFDERVRAEIDIKPEEPFSHEFIPTDLSVPGCWWPSIRVFCWNVFALRAKEVGRF